MDLSGVLPAKKTNWTQFGTLISVFFFWGFVAASNDILIPVFHEKFNLTHAQSQLVSFAFYVAYTVGSLIYVGISKLLGGDLLNKMGYKNGEGNGWRRSGMGWSDKIDAFESSSASSLISDAPCWRNRRHRPGAGVFPRDRNGTKRRRRPSCRKRT